jgi:hypothetical protein
MGDVKTELIIGEICEQLLSQSDFVKVEYLNKSKSLMIKICNIL